MRCSSRRLDSRGRNRLLFAFGSDGGWAALVTAIQGVIWFDPPRVICGFCIGRKKAPRLARFDGAASCILAWGQLYERVFRAR